MKICIINTAVGLWYPEGQTRLKATLEKEGYTGDVIFHTQYPDNVPTHAEHPYAFKPYAMQEARGRGYDIVLWLDAAIWVQHSIHPILDLIEQQGYFFPRNGWTTGQWCTDAMLDHFNITREKALTIPHMMACVIGLDMRKEPSVNFLDQWIQSIPSFPGAWSNEGEHYGKVSPDTRVLGHRHDQSAASIIATRLGMEFTPPHGYLTYSNETDAILVSAGM